MATINISNGLVHSTGAYCLSAGSGGSHIMVHNDYVCVPTLCTGSTANFNDLIVSGNLTVHGTCSILNTTVCTTSAMSICNQGTGPALTVTQCGSQPVALFVDQECGNALCIGDNGTATFGARVDVHNSAASYGTRLSVGRDSAQSIYFQVNDADNYIRANQDESALDHGFYIDRQFTTSTCRDDFHISRCGSPQVTVDINGQVGIGTTDPAFKLNVSSCPASEPYAQALFRTEHPSSSYGGIVVSGNNQAHIRFLTGTGTWGGAGAKQWQIRSGLASNADKLSVFSWTAGCDVMTWNAAGNVGIGTTAPTSKLHVIGNAYISTTLAVGSCIVTSYSNNAGIEIGSGGANITAASPSNKEIIFQDLGEFRFGPSNWDYNCWAGIKYDAANTDLIIGGPNSSAFTCNSNPPNIGVIFAGVDKVTINNCGGSDCNFVITRSGSTTAGLNLGVCADSSAIIASENSDLRLGKKCSGTFYEYSKICSSTGHSYINCDLFLPASVSKISLGPQSSGGDVHIGSSGLGSPTYGAQDYGAYIAHNAYRQTDGAWKHSRTSTICAALLEIAGGGSSGNAQGFYFSGASNAGTGNITWNTFAALGSGGLTLCGTLNACCDANIRATTNGWAGGLHLISQDGGYDFCLHPDNIGVMYVNKTWCFNDGDLRFGKSNPYICASSYIVMPGGLYVSGGTAYFQNHSKHRNGIGNDTGAWLCITGGTAGDTSFGGNVGIGTTDPAVSLHIKDSTSVIKLDRNNTSYGPAIQLGRCGSNIWTIKESYQGGNNRDLTFMDCNDYPKVTFQQSGDVGIGTSSPSAKLDVCGTGTVFSVNGTNGTLFSVEDDLSDSLMSVNDAAGLPVLEVFADSSVCAGRYSCSDFYIASGGNIGIGTTDFSYTQVDNTPLIGSKTNNRLFVNGSLQLMNNNDAIVIGRGTATFLKDEELGFGWGGGWYQTEGTYLCVRNGKTLCNTGNACFGGSLCVGGNTCLGNGSGDYTHINDILHVAATDSGDAHFYFGEGSTGGTSYGAYWNWDSGYRHSWCSQNAGTLTMLMTYVTNNLDYLCMGRSLHMGNKAVHYSSEVHFQCGARFRGVDGNGIDLCGGTTAYLRMNPGNSTQGYLYSEGGGAIGFLDSGGSWGIKHVNDVGTYFYDNGATFRMCIGSGTTCTCNRIDINSNSSGVTGGSAPNYGDAQIEIQTLSNYTPAISFHRGGYSATTLHEYDGELYVSPWTTRSQAGKLVSFGNIGCTTITFTNNGSNICMDGGGSAEGIRMQPDSCSTYPVFLRMVNPGTGEGSPWLYKENSAEWGIWHNNPVNSFDFTRSGSGGITNNVGGGTNQVAIRLNSATCQVCAAGSMVAPIYYDYNNTNCFIDSAGSSRVNQICHNGQLYYHGSAGGTAINTATYDGYASMRVIRNQNGSSPYNDGMFIGYGNSNSGVTRLYGGGSTGCHSMICSNGFLYHSNGNRYVYQGDQDVMMFRGTITSHDWNTFIDGTESSFYQVNAHSGSNRPAGSYTYGTAMSFSANNAGKFQLYAPHNGSEGCSLWYRTGWNTDYDAWAKIWDSANDGAGSGLDADLLDGLNSTNFVRCNYNTNNVICFGSGTNTGHGSCTYAIFQEGGSWQWPYPDLRIAYHTGIKIGANGYYQGIRFYDEYDMGSQVMSVNNNSDGLGCQYVYINNGVQIGSGTILYGSGVSTFNEAGANSDFRVEAQSTSTGPLGNKAYALFVDASAGAVGIGTSQPSYALEVNGTAFVTGTFSAGTKNFLIDHPTKENYMLRHGSLEGPENAVYVRGTTTSSSIELPEYWTGLVDEDTITATLTPRGKYLQLFLDRVEDNEIHVGGTEIGELYDYVIYGTRKDVEDLIVEFERPVGS